MPIRQKILLLYLIITISSAITIKAQVVPDSTLTGRRVIQIFIHGNEKTKEEIILREMKIKEGDIIDWQRLEEDQKRIVNLYLFNRVLLFAEPKATEAIIRIVVTERWYIFPVPLFFVNDRDWSKLSYGLGLTHSNFRGRGENLNGVFWLGYNPSVRLSYSNPWIGGKAHIFTQFTGYSNHIESKHFGDKVTELHQGMLGVIGKRFGYHTRLNINLGFKSVTMKPIMPGQTLSANGRDNTLYAGLSFVWDRRDYTACPHTGWYLSTSISKYGFGGEVNFNRFRCEGRGYFPVTSNITLAFRAATIISKGDIPIYDRIYLGYSERIRGHFNRIIQGENRLLISTSLRFPLLPIRHFSLGNMPQLSNLPFGISWNIFVDAGWIGMQDQEILWSDRIAGFGAGLLIHLPYINILRFEMAWNEEGQSQFITDLFIDI
ncbi:BamA/TamA family outer membrane protein [bacterium]|nr:BamA/TamA family outer membrane protein [bacterium]